MPAWLVTAPVGEPVTLGEAKAQLRLETAEDDAQVSGLITAARAHIEQVLCRGLVTQQWELVLPGFHVDNRHHVPHHFAYEYPPQFGMPVGGTHLHHPDNYIELPHGNLATLESDPAVESVKYVDGAGVQQTLATTEYTVDPVNTPGRVRLAFGKTWPTTRVQWDAVRIRYSVGWAVADVPQPIKQALMLLVSQMYEHRTPEVIGSIVSRVQFAVDALLAPHRILLP